MADQKISALSALLQADVQATTDVLPIADISTAETKKVTPAALVGAGVSGLAAGTIDGSKIKADSVTTAQIAPNAITASELADNAVDTAAIADGAVTTAKIADDSVTAAQIAPDAIGHSELANGAVDTHAIQDLSVTTPKLAIGAVGTAQIAADAVGTAQLADGGVTTTKVADGAIVTAKIDDGAVIAAKLAGGAVGSTALDANSVTTTKVADGAITAAKLANDLDGSEFLAQGAKAVLIGPGAGGAAVPSFRLLVPTDIPKLEAANLPVATPTVLGAVKVGAGLAADGSGVLGIANTVTGGTSSKVTFNSSGLITGSAALTAGDIPDLDAAKIVSGTLGAAQIGSGAISREKLANYAVSFIQEASPSTANQHVGMLWLQESTGQLRMWNGNSWFPVGFGRLSAENLRYCGTFDATTGLITGVTQFGTQGGYAIGQAIPAAKDSDTGTYFVCNNPGNGASVAAGVTFDAGDWILCNGAAAGWARIDTLNGGGGGGGGGATHLGDLLDVTLTSSAAGNFLSFDSSGQWVNAAVVDGGTY